MARHFFTCGLVLRGRTVGVYMANDGEVDTLPLLKRLLATRKRVALPVIRDHEALEFYRYRANTTLVTNRFGIPEPAPGAPFVAPLALDLLLMPLVAFDGHGVRLGMGAGFYDRYLGRLPAALRPCLVGVAHEVQRAAEPLPCAEWDVPLDGIITENGWQSFETR